MCVSVCVSRWRCCCWRCYFCVFCDFDRFVCELSVLLLWCCWVDSYIIQSALNNPKRKTTWFGWLFFFSSLVSLSWLVIMLFSSCVANTPQIRVWKYIWKVLSKQENREQKLLIFRVEFRQNLFMFLAKIAWSGWVVVALIMTGRLPWVKSWWQFPHQNPLATTVIRSKAPSGDVWQQAIHCDQQSIFSKN